MKQMGRRHRPFYRICAMDQRTPRDGRVLEELGTHDPMVPEADARTVLNGERIDYWLSVGAQPSDKVKVLIKKYGSRGTHLGQQQAALDRLAQQRGVRAAAAAKAKAEQAAAEPLDEPSAEPADQPPPEPEQTAAEEEAPAAEEN
jgi:small subunit ribosomal protein S16